MNGGIINTNEKTFRDHRSGIVMVKLFPDFINDHLYLKRKFTDEEKLIIENLINRILRKDPESSITENYIAEGDPFGFSLHSTEYILKRFMYKKEEFFIYFIKVYPENIKGPIEKEIKMIAYSLTFENLSPPGPNHGIVDVYLKYDQNNLLTLETKEKIENEISREVINSIDKAINEKQ